ncbi:MAG: DUF4388 domain-containing protein [Planctomycetales bacterium]|nr:DUF4388 domain-containing protein [Planctomycetales bacterium]
MGLKGDLDSISLADIFQTLSMTGQEGTLVVRGSDQVKYIHFTRDGVSLLTSGEKKMGRLGDMLVGLGKISPDDLRSALTRQKETGGLIGETLTELGLVTPKDIENAVRIQIEEEIYDLFSWTNANFEFNEGAAPENFFAEADQPVTRLTFNVNSLIMEAARRIDEWDAIEQQIASTKEIFVLDSPRSLEGEWSPQERLVLEALDGERNVDEVIDTTHVPKFEVCKFLARLVEEGRVKRAPIEHLLERGDARREAGDHPAALKFFERALAGKLRKTSDMAEVRQRMADSLVALGKKKEASEQFKALADLRAEAHDVEGAINFWQKVIDLNPLDLENKEKLISVYLENREHLDPDRSDVIRSIEYSLFKNGKALAMAFSYAGQVDKAKDVLKKLVDLTPSNLELRKTLVNIHLEANEKAEAVEELERMAALLVANRKFDELGEVYEKVLKVNPAREDIRKKLGLLQKQQVAAAAPPPPPRRPGRLLAGTLVLAVLVVGGAFGFWNFVKVPGDSAADLAKATELARTAEGFPESAPYPQIEAAFREAAAAYRALADRYSLTTHAGGWRARAETLDKTREERKSAWQAQCARLAKGARDQLDEIRGRMERFPWDDGAHERALEEARAGCEGNPAAAEVAKAIAAALLEIRNYLQDRRADLERGESAVKEGRLVEAWGALKRLWNDAPFQDRAPSLRRTVRFPVLVETEPQGAQLTLDGRPALGEDGKPAATPHLLRRGFGDLLAIRAERLGYEPAERTVKVDREAEARVTLKLRLRLYPLFWATAAPNSLEHPIAVTDQGPLALTEECRVQPLETTDRGVQPLGEATRLGAGGLADNPTGPPAIAGDVLVVSSRDGLVSARNIREGRPLWPARYDARGGGSARPVGSPCVDRGRRLAFVSTTAGRLHAIRLEDGQAAWVETIADGAELTPPVLCGDWVVVGVTKSGELRGLSAAEGLRAGAKPEPFVFRIGAPLRMAPLAYDGGLLVITAEGASSRLLLVDPPAGSGKGAQFRAQRPAASLPGEPAEPPVLSLDRSPPMLFVAVPRGSDKGLLIGWNLEDWNILWSTRRPGIEVGVGLRGAAIHGRSLYAAAGNRLHVYDLETGALRAEIELPAKEQVWTALSVAPSGHVFIVTRDERKVSRVYVVRE